MWNVIDVISTDFFLSIRSKLNVYSEGLTFVLLYGVFNEAILNTSTLKENKVFKHSLYKQYMWTKLI